MHRILITIDKMTFNFDHIVRFYPSGNSTTSIETVTSTYTVTEPYPVVFEAIHKALGQEVAIEPGENSVSSLI